MALPNFRQISSSPGPPPGAAPSPSSSRESQVHISVENSVTENELIVLTTIWNFYAFERPKNCDIELLSYRNDDGRESRLIQHPQRSVNVPTL